MTPIVSRKYKWLRLTVVIISSILLLFIIAVICLQTSAVKNYIRNKAVSYLQNKIGTEVRIGKLDYHLPHSIELSDVLLIDQRKDSLLYGQLLRVDINMFKLIMGNISISEIELKSIKVNISRKLHQNVFGDGPRNSSLRTIPGK